jgi:site-specific recombinase XerD
LALLYPSTRNSQELVFGHHDAHETAATANSSSQGLAGLCKVGTDVSSHNMRKTFATRLLSRGAAITDVQHLLGHASVKTTEKAYAAFVKNERFKQTIDLLYEPQKPMLKIVR